AVCSGRNADLVRLLGADHVVDYTQEDFTRGDRRYDLVLDIAGTRSFAECRRVLAPEARVVVIGAPKDPAMLGPLRHIAAMRLGAVRSGHEVIFFVAK